MKFAAAQPVKVVDETLQRHGEVGTVIGEDEDTGEVGVKMDSDDAIEHFHPDAVKAL